MVQQIFLMSFTILSALGITDYDQSHSTKRDVSAVAEESRLLLEPQTEPGLKNKEVNSEIITPIHSLEKINANLNIFNSYREKYKSKKLNTTNQYSNGIEFRIVEKPNSDFNGIFGAQKLSNNGK